MSSSLFANRKLSFFEPRFFLRSGESNIFSVLIGAVGVKEGISIIDLC